MGVGPSAHRPFRMAVIHPLTIRFLPLRGEEVTHEVTYRTVQYLCDEDQSLTEGVWDYLDEIARFDELVDVGDEVFGSHQLAEWLVMCVKYMKECDEDADQGTQPVMIVTEIDEDPCAPAA